jgi:hypothetical protein
MITVERSPDHKRDGDGLFDFKFINRIPITNVARKLRFEFDGAGGIICWHPERHQNGNESFLRVLRSNKVKCDACNSEPMSVLDMVKDCGQFPSLREAAECVAIDFDVRRTARASHLNNPERLVVPPACEDPLRLLIVSGVWSELSAPTRCLIPVLLSLADWNEDKSEGTVTVCYQGLMTYSGMGSPNSISRALRELYEIGWLEVLDSPRHGAIQPTATYLIKPLSQAVKDLADKTAPGFGDAIKAEKAQRKQQQKKRVRELAAHWNQGVPVRFGDRSMYR